MVIHTVGVFLYNFQLNEKRSAMRVFVYKILILLLIGFCIAGCSKDSDQTVDALNAEALRLAQAGQKDQALSKAMAALDKSEMENGAGHPNTIMSLEILGLVYQAMNDAGNAESAFLRALSVAKKSVGPDSSEAAKIMNNLGGLYYAQNQYILAASFFKQSLVIVEKQIPENDPRLAVLRKNIDVCEAMQGGVMGQTSGNKAIDGENTAAASQNNPPGDPIMNPPVNLPQDLVPQQIKDSSVSQLAKQNIFISDLEPRTPVLIDNKGMVFPYYALKKGKDTDAAQEIVVLFAAIKNPQNPKAIIFQQCRLISHSSYLSALEKGGVPQLKQELLEVFPSLYL